MIFFLSILCKKYNILFNPHSKMLSAEQFSIKSTILNNNGSIVQSNKISMTAEMSPSLLRLLKKNKNIVAIEEDMPVKIQSLLRNQLDVHWNLNRISLSTNGHRPIMKYRYPLSGGSNALVYVVDTGIKRTDDLKNITYPAIYFTEKMSNEDDNGHGTHVGGIVASALFGVAKNSQLVSLKVLDSTGSGSVSSILAAFDYILNDESNKRKIVNLSIGGFHSSLLNIMIHFLTEKNIIVIAAAGNENANACRYSPASSTDAITVGAIDQNDKMAPFSNYGKCVDIYAPGVQILSDWIEKKRKASGTSMATPHVVGAIALYVSEDEYKHYSPKEIKRIILKDAQVTGELKILSTRALLHQLREKEL